MINSDCYGGLTFLPSVDKRITVDEILTPELIRFEVRSLKPGIEDFFDESKDWGMTAEELVPKSHYKRKFGFLPPWETLSEGQVFLYGAFKVVGDEAKPNRFKMATGQAQTKRIDNLEAFKNRVKRVYSDLLTRRR